MYSPKVREDQVKKLYELREHFTRNGKKMTMTGMVQEAVDMYIADLEGREEMAKEKYFSKLTKNETQISFNKTT